VRLAVAKADRAIGFSRDDLLLTLKTPFGYGAFRPLQREITEAPWPDRDVLPCCDRRQIAR